MILESCNFYWFGAQDETRTRTAGLGSEGF